MKKCLRQGALRCAGRAPFRPPQPARESKRLAPPVGYDPKPKQQLRRQRGRARRSARSGWSGSGSCTASWCPAGDMRRPDRAQPRRLRCAARKFRYVRRSTVGQRQIFRLCRCSYLAHSIAWQRDHNLFDKLSNDLFWRFNPLRQNCEISFHTLTKPICPPICSIDN